MNMQSKVMRIFIVVSVFIVIALAFLGLMYSFEFISPYELKYYATKSVAFATTLGLASIIISTLLSFSRKK